MGVNTSALNNPIIKSIADKLPFLKRIRRSLLARKDVIMPGKRTYSQFGEDLMVMELLNNPVSSDYIYMDIGANQPTQISNTYLFYRMGFRGIVIEPNHELSDLFRRYRPEDIYLEIGCSECSGLGKFKISESSVLSGFSENIKLMSESYKWVPLLTIDEIWLSAGEKKNIFLMSIDTEGFDLKVLKGAAEALQMTTCVIVEICEDNCQEIKEFLVNSGFKLYTTTAGNMIWFNEKMTKWSQ